MTLHGHESCPTCAARYCQRHDDPTPVLNVAYFVAKRLDVPLTVVLDVPDEVLMAMSRYMHGRLRGEGQ